MATRSTIAVQHKNGIISQIYAHWNGYLSHNGRILLHNYTTLEQAEELVILGDISTLGERVTPIGEHTFDKPEKGTTVYYMRDRGEDECEPRTFTEFEPFRTNMQQEEYDYLYMDGKWLVSDHTSPFVELTQELIDNED